MPFQDKVISDFSYVCQDSIIAAPVPPAYLDEFNCRMGAYGSIRPTISNQSVDRLTTENVALAGFRGELVHGLAVDGNNQLANKCCHQDFEYDNDKRKASFESGFMDLVDKVSDHIVLASLQLQLISTSLRRLIAYLTFPDA